MQAVHPAGARPTRRTWTPRLSVSLSGAFRRATFPGIPWVQRGPGGAAGARGAEPVTGRGQAAAGGGARRPLGAGPGAGAQERPVSCGRRARARAAAALGSQGQRSWSGRSGAGGGGAAGREAAQAGRAPFCRRAGPGRAARRAASPGAGRAGRGWGWGEAGRVGRGPSPPPSVPARRARGVGAEDVRPDVLPPAQGGPGPGLRLPGPAGPPAAPGVEGPRPVLPLVQQEPAVQQPGAAVPAAPGEGERRPDLGHLGILKEKRSKGIAMPLRSAACQTL